MQDYRPPAAAMAYGLGHFVTFDGTRFSFPGKGYFVTEEKPAADTTALAGPCKPPHSEKSLPRAAKPLALAELRGQRQQDLPIRAGHFLKLLYQFLNRLGNACSLGHFGARGTAFSCIQKLIRLDVQRLGKFLQSRQ